MSFCYYEIILTNTFPVAYPQIQLRPQVCLKQAHWREVRKQARIMTLLKTYSLGTKCTMKCKLGSYFTNLVKVSETSSLRETSSPVI